MEEETGGRRGPALRYADTPYKRWQKAEGVTIYTIAYDIHDARIRDLLRGCATDPADYFEPSGVAGIGAVFDEIFAQIAESAWLSE